MLIKDYGVHTTFNVIDLIPFVGSNWLRQGPITRAMLKHLEANKESETPVQIKMLTILSFEDSCKICEKYNRKIWVL